MQPQPELTLKLFDFLDTFLGVLDRRYLERFSYLAEVISIKLKDDGLYKIVHYPNEEHPDWEGFYVWRFNDWVTQHAKWLSDKEAAEQRRIAKYILDENVRRLSRRLMTERFGFYEQFALPIAYQIMTRNRVNAIKEIGYKPITKVDEI